MPEANSRTTNVSLIMFIFKEYSTFPIKTYDDFWTMNLSKKIVKQNKLFDVIYSANTISHIHNLNETFKAVHNSLNDNGIFILF